MSYLGECVLDKFKNAVANYEDNTFLIEDCGEKMSYKEVDYRSDSIALFLKQIGCRSGDRAVICIKNKIDYVIIMFGCIKANITFIPVFYDVNDYSLEYILDDATPQIVIKEENGDITFYLSENEVIWTWKDIKWGGKYEVLDNKNSVVMILYTSGSTGNPKGVVEENENIVFITNAINEKIQNRSSDIILCGLPLNFDYSLYQVFLAIEVGATVVLMNPKEMPVALPRIIEKYQITALPLVPSLINYIISYGLYKRGNWSSVRYISSTGDVLSTKNILKLCRIFSNIDIFSMYGLTECKRVSILDVKKEMKYIDSVGKGLRGIRTKIVGEDGQELEANEIGELVVIGKNVMKGYWNDSNSLQAKFLEQNGEMALYTGDFFRKNELGYLFYCGRDSMMMKVKGFRISVAKIEKCIEAIEGVVDVAVFKYDEENGKEGIAAVVEVEEKCLVNGRMLIEDICAEKLEIYEVPDKYFIISEHMPKNNNGKKDRQFIKAKYLSESRE